MMDEEEWPSLGGPGSAPAVTRTNVATQHPQQQQQQQHHQDTEDWEMLQKETNTSISFELVDQEVPSVPTTTSTTEQSARTRSTSTGSCLATKPLNKKVLRRYESSPNLSGMDRIVEEIPDPLILGSVQEEDDSFAFVSGPASVLSATTTGTVSWALLAGSPTKQEEQQQQQKSPLAAAAAFSPNKTRARPQPKFVVVHTKPMRRCSKSTGDLQALVEEEEQVGGGSGGVGAGACDAMEFYHRKAIGAASRSNGLKLRPDEAARKSMIMAKKSEQRRKQQQASGAVVRQQE